MPLHRNPGSTHGLYEHTQYTYALRNSVLGTGSLKVMQYVYVLRIHVRGIR